MIQPPCYDTAKKMDCPERTSDCHISCSKWAEYVKKRDYEYDRRKYFDTDDTEGKNRTIRRFFNRSKGRTHGGSAYKERQE